MLHTVPDGPDTGVSVRVDGRDDRARGIDRHGHNRSACRGGCGVVAVAAVGVGVEKEDGATTDQAPVGARPCRLELAASRLAVVVVAVVVAVAAVPLAASFQCNDADADGHE
jgi:hypothetical protein